MCIAQRFVAREEETRAAQNEMAEPGSAPEMVFSTDEINLKWATFRAVHRSMHVNQLPTRARALLAALARTVDNTQPLAKIFASRKTLAARAMISDRTCFRALDDLAEWGLIKRYEQWATSGRAGFNRAYIELTEQAAALLGLLEKPSTLKLGVAGSKGTNDQCEKYPEARSATVADPIKIDLDPKIQKRQPGQLPAELERLLDLGFSKFFIFALMKEARENDKRLSDVIEACWPNIKAARRPICYVRALLKSTFDFSHQIATQRTSAAEVAKKTVNESLIRATVSSHAGATFTDVNETLVATISSDAKTLTVVRKAENILRVSVHGWQDEFVRMLRTGAMRVRPNDTSRTGLGPPVGQIGRAMESVTVTISSVDRVKASGHLASLKTLLRGPRFEPA